MCVMMLQQLLEDIEVKEVRVKRSPELHGNEEAMGKVQQEISDSK